MPTTNVNGLCITTRNSKVPFAQVNLPPVLTCAKDAPCKAKCYAMKAWRMYRATREAYSRNLALWQLSPEAFEKALVSFLEGYKKQYFRWHSSGDIPSMDYLDMMVRIAKRFPAIKFLCFSKRRFINGIAFPSNMIVRFSNWGDYREDTPLQAEYIPPHCEAPKGSFVCPGKCGPCLKCWSKRVKLVSFHSH